MNLCRPDDRKSCGACCGLYNTPDSTGATLLGRLTKRTRVFSETPRTPDALMRFEAEIRSCEALTTLDSVIHVCEFLGFTDPAGRLPGCMLHPEAPGNNGIDLRGMCHYGSLACRTFFCPAWDELDGLQRDAVVAVLDDWRLYGLVITDVDFVRAVFGLIEHALGRPPSREELIDGPLRGAFGEMLSWKDTLPGTAGTLQRTSRYFRRPVLSDRWGPEEMIDVIVRSVEFAAGREAACAKTVVVERLEALRKLERSE